MGKHGTCMKQGDHNILFQMPKILLFVGCTLSYNWVFVHHHGKFL